MVSEESRLFMMKNYPKMQKKREQEIRNKILGEIEEVITEIFENHLIGETAYFILKEKLQELEQ